MALIQGKKMRSEAAHKEVSEKYYVTPRTVAAICYGELDARRAKDSQKKGQVMGAASAAQLNGV